MKPIGSMLLLVALAFTAVRQARAQEPFLQRYELPRHLKKKAIHEIFEAPSGWLWISGEGFVVRFNGWRFEETKGTRESETYASFFTREDTLLVADHSGRLWAVVNDSLHPWLDHPRIRARITGCTHTGKTTYLSTYGGGLWRMRGGQVDSVETGYPNSEYIYGMVHSKASGLLVLATDNGLRVIGQGASREAVKALDNEIVNGLVEDAEGVIWLSTHSAGLWRFDPQRLELRQPETALSPHDMQLVRLTATGAGIWFGTQKGRLYHYAPQEGWLRGVWLENRTKRIQVLSSDRTGNLWISGPDHSFECVNGRSMFIRDHEGVSFRELKAIVADDRGNIWFSNDDGLFSHHRQFTGFSRIRRHVLDNDPRHEPIICLAADHLGYLWAGTFNNGVYRIDPTDGSFRHYTTENGLFDNNVLSIHPDSAFVWLSTFGGISRMPVDKAGKGPATFESFSALESVGNGYVYDIFTDSKGRTWFGTDGNGAAVFEEGRFVQLKKRMGEEGRQVHFIVEDDRGHIWFATPDDGLFRFDGSSFKHFRQHGTSEPFDIRGLVNWPGGGIVIIQPDGVDLLTPETEELTRIGEAYGIRDLDTKMNATCIDRQGVLWIGSSQYCLRLQLPELYRPHQLATTIDAVELFFDPIDTGRQGSFAYDENHLTFRYSSFWFQNPGSVKYEYRLEGYDLDWRPTTDRQVTYASLPPGNYVFHLRATAFDNFDEAGVVSYAFVIGNPFWRQWWFIFCLLVVFVLAVIGTIRYREQRLVEANLRERERVRFHLETLKSQVNPHFLFNSFIALIHTIETSPKTAVTFVEKLSAFFRNVLEYREEPLVSLAVELEICKSYLYMQEQRFPGAFHIEWEVTDASLHRLLPPMTLQIVLENVFQHNAMSGEAPVHISVRSTDGYLVVSNDLQPRIAPVESKGIGLVNIRQQYALLGFTGPEVEREEGRFTVKLPLLDEDEAIDY